ncbi:MAG TPA: hypothetical protein VF755_14720, partial [Catenuloplanes sp.]
MTQHFAKGRDVVDKDHRTTGEVCLAQWGVAGIDAYSVSERGAITERRREVGVEQKETSTAGCRG